MLASILKFIFISLEVVVLFNLLIIVHELGHFLAARWRGLVIEKFGIWFGKPIWKKTVNGVEYSLGCIPAGGFVALPQMAPMEAMEGDSNLDRKTLPPISTTDKIIVAFAGPLFSFGLAIFFACIVWALGRPVSEGDLTTTIGYVMKDSPAEKSGLLPGDKILEVDGHSVARFNGGASSIVWRIVSSRGDTIPIKVARNGEVYTFEPKPIIEEGRLWERKSLRQILILPKQIPMIGKIAPNSPAAAAGLKPNDLVVSVEGKPILTSMDISEAIEANPDRPVRLTIQRGIEFLDFTVKPRLPVSGDKPRLGIVWDIKGKYIVDRPAPWDQIYMSVETMVNTLTALVTPRSQIKLQHMNGPLGIMRIYYALFESDQGWRIALWFSVILNVNLALLNLVPFPVLDGGHITIAIIERLRKKEIPGKLLEIVQSGCAILLMTYMAYITFFDVQDYGSIFKPKAAPTEMIFTPE